MVRILKRNKRSTGTMLALIFALLAVPLMVMGRKAWRQRLNHQLIVAVNRDDTPSALCALKAGADANAVDADESIPVWQRLWYQLHGYRPALSTSPPPLYVALMYRPKDNPELVEALLEHGARAHAVGETGNAPLFYALFQGKSATARVLLEHGALGSGSIADANLLTVAVMQGNDAATIEMILQHGGDPDRVDVSGRTPLGMAVREGKTAIVKILLRHHADPNKTSWDLPGATRPLEFARKHHMNEIASLLSNARAFP